MLDNDGPPPTSRPPSRRRHIVRLVVFAAFLVVLFYLLAVRHVVDIEDVRRTVKATGPAAPLTYIVLSAVLGAMFAPAPTRPASSGLLFGPVLGVLVTLGATVGTAIVASLVGRRAGRDSARALLGSKRADRREPRRPSGRPRQRAGAAGIQARRPHRRVDRTTRAVGGGRSALRSRP